MAELIIDEMIFEFFPFVRLGLVKAENIDNTPAGTQSKASRLKAALAAGVVQTEKYLLKEEFYENKVIKVWHEAFSRFNAGKETEASVVTLIKTAHDKREIPGSTALEDICNSDSLIWALPITFFDRDKISGDLHLGFLNEELCFYDENGALTKDWCAGTAQRAAVSGSTKNALIIINLIDPTRAMELTACLNTLTKQTVSYLKAQSSFKVLEPEAASAEI